MQRREFLIGGAGVVGAGAVGSLTGQGKSQDKPVDITTSKTKPFKLKYAPHLGMFRHHAKDPIDQIHFMADQGFRAFEDNGMANRKPQMQTKIANALEKHGMTMRAPRDRFMASQMSKKPSRMVYRRDRLSSGLLCALR